MEMRLVMLSMMIFLCLVVYQLCPVASVPMSVKVQALIHTTHLPRTELFNDTEALNSLQLQRLNVREIKDFLLKLDDSNTVIVNDILPILDVFEVLMRSEDYVHMVDGIHFYRYQVPVFAVTIEDNNCGRIIYVDINRYKRECGELLSVSS